MIYCGVFEVHKKAWYHAIKSSVSILMSKIKIDNKISLTESQQSDLAKILEDNLTSNRIRTRVRILLLRSEGYVYTDICSRLNTSPYIVRATIKNWVLHGIESVCETPTLPDALVDNMFKPRYGEESCTKQVSVRIPPSMLKELRAKNVNIQEVCRTALRGVLAG